MYLKLKSMLYDYEEHKVIEGPLNESFADHLSKIQYYVGLVSQNNLDLQSHNIYQYKTDLITILDYHEEEMGTYPKNTYTILRKAINALVY